MVSETRMRRFRVEQRWGWTIVDARMQQGFDTAAQAEQVLQRQTIATLDETELRNAVQHERLVQQRQIKQEAAARVKEPSPRM